MLGWQADPNSQPIYIMALMQHRTALPPDHETADGLAYLAALGYELARPTDPGAALSGALAELASRFAARGAGLYEFIDGEDAPACVASCGELEPLGPRARGAVISAPLILGGRRIGLVALAAGENRAFQPGDQNTLEIMALPFGLALSRFQLSEALARQDGVERELALAAEIQRNLLPRAAPGAFPVHGLNRPIRQVSGDFFDYFTRGGDAIAFALGDVSGKGINAALLMAKASALFRCLAKTCEDPARLLGMINREICETVSHGMFVTMVAGVYDGATGRVRFANAGHEPPLLRAPDRSYQDYPAAAPPLGILPELRFETEEAALEGGEFYIFSDGLTEYRYDQQEALGVTGIIQLIESLADLPLAERLSALLAELDQEGWEARDDLTVLAIDDAWVRPR